MLYLIQAASQQLYHVTKANVRILIFMSMYCDDYSNQSPCNFSQCTKNISPYRCSDCRKNKCMFNQQYGDETDISGQYVEDSIYIGQIGSLSGSAVYPIGCVNIIKQKGGWDGSFGIMGLMHQNYKYFPNLIEQLTDKNNRSFALCFNQSDAYMTIGRIDRSNSIPYYIGSNRQYKIKILDIKSDGYIFNQTYFETAEIMVDSGTNQFVIGDKEIFDSFFQHFNTYVSRNANIQMTTDGFQCVQRKTKQDKYFDLFPTYKFKLENGYELNMDPCYYLTNVNYNNLYCFHIVYLPQLNGIILGTPFLMGYEFTFDQTNMEINIKENCSYESIEQILLFDYQNITKEIPKEQDNIQQENEIAIIDTEDQNQIIQTVIIILVIFLILMMLSIAYYLRRLKLISQQQTEKALIAEIQI